MVIGGILNLLFVCQSVCLFAMHLLWSCCMDFAEILHTSDNVSHFGTNPWSPTGVPPAKPKNKNVVLLRSTTGASIWHLLFQKRLNFFQTHNPWSILDGLSENGTGYSHGDLLKVSHHINIHYLSSHSADGVSCCRHAHNVKRLFHTVR